MAQLAQSNTRIINDQAFAEIFAALGDQLRGELDGKRYILNIELAPEGNHFHVGIDPRQDQVELIDAALKSAEEGGRAPELMELEFASELKRIWANYDYEDLVLCLISVGRATQLTTIPKPWVNDGKPAHRHCPCGIREGADADHDADHAEGRVVQYAAERLQAVLEEHKVPESHGLEHAHRVLQHTRGAIDALSEEVPRAVRLALVLAALLHDSDDRKYFGDDSKNAEAILDTVLAGLDDAPGFAPGNAADVKATALEAISYVSTSKNGNDIPEAARANPLLLYPRYADRLEATGEIGVVRCWKYTEEVGRPLFLDSTPQPSTAEEVLHIATEERFRAYQERGESASMIDHFFDKLVHLVHPLVSHSNRYFASLGMLRLEPLVEVCTASRPDALQARLQLAEERVKQGAI